MATVGEHPNVINLIAACTETGISQFNFKPGHRCMSLLLAYGDLFLLSYMQTDVTIPNIVAQQYRELLRPFQCT